jgi:cellulose synthase/poly-beta-1,6-N-acetylglucosamine synthase-like glycosyltransferase
MVNSKLNWDTKYNMVRLRVSMSITVGICAYNEGMNIGPLLNNILYSQNLPAGSEVLVACSGCTDDTVDIVEQYACKNTVVKILLEAERSGKASAINQILKRASGDVIIFISADTLPNDGCFAHLISKIKVSNVGLVCAYPLPTNSSKSLAGKLVHILWSFHDQVFREVNEAGLARHASEVYCVRRDIVDSIPAGTVNDDAYIALKVANKGWLISYEPLSRVSIRGPETLSDYFKQRRRVIFGHHQVKKLTGQTPQYFVPLLRLDLKRKKNLFYWLFTEYDIFVLLAFIWIELILNSVVMLDSARGKSHSVWSISASTKKGINLKS